MSRHSTQPRGEKPVRAATYFRMSRDEQEHSIERQQQQVRPYAQRVGYEIVKEYTDEGVRGWKAAEDRPAFQQMLNDAQRGLFDVILCDDVDRFGRYDPITYGAVVSPLRDANVRLETVAQGRIDWNDTLSQLTDSMRMAFKKEESRTTSRRILTRFMVMAREGKWINGTPPYGFAVNEETGRLVLGDATQVKVVQWMFDSYAKRDVSIRWIALELHNRGVLSPTGKEWWSIPSIHKVLKNRNYLGICHWNTSTVAEFNHLQGGQIVKRDEDRSRRRKKAEPEWIVVPGTHPAIVDQETFDAVQAKLAGHQKRTTPKVAGGDFLLSGMMVCGHCGGRMVAGNPRQNRKRVFYECNSYRQYGKTACNRHTIYEADLVACIAAKIQEDFLNPDNFAKLREEMRRQAEAERKEAPCEAARLRRQIEQLDRKIQQGNERLAVVDVDMVAGLSATIRGWRQERERIEQQLRDAEQGPDIEAIELQLAQAEALLWQLREALDRSDPTELRAVLRELVEKVELYWTHTNRGPHVVSKFARGLIYLKVDEQMSRLVGGSPVVNDALGALRYLVSRLDARFLARLRGVKPEPPSEPPTAKPARPIDDRLWTRLA